MKMMMKNFVKTVDNFQPLTILEKISILHICLDFECASARAVKLKKKIVDLACECTLSISINKQDQT